MSKGRSMAAIAAAMTALVVLAQPAEAKCGSAERVVVRGPASAPDLELTREQWGVPRSDASPTAVVIEGMLGRYPKDPAPPPRLGPRYRLLYFLELHDFRTNTTRVEVLEQHLYPRTSAGPMTFTPRQVADVSCVGGNNVRISTGWQPFPQELLDRLQRFGLPPAASLPPERAEVHRGRVVGTVLAAGLLFAIGILGARGRGARRPKVRA